jgi:uncharacterized membrane protein
VIRLSEKTPANRNIPAFSRQGFATDLILVVIWLAAGIIAVYLPLLHASPLRVILVLPIVLFIPGYCLIAALFPKEGEIELIERIAFSFGLSIAIIPLVGFLLNFTPWGIRLDPIVISLTLLTLVMILCAYYRRAILSPEKRFTFPFSESAGSVRKQLFPPGNSSVNNLLSAVLILVFLIAILTTLYVFTVPKEGEPYTEFFILGENQNATQYPDQINVSQNYPMFIGVKNHEKRNITYSIETWLVHTEFNNVTNTTSIMEMDPNDRLFITLPRDGTVIIPYNLSVSKPGYNRLEFLLFNENVPGFEVTGKDRINASYRNLHLWVNVLDGQDQENQIDIPA